MKKTGMIIVSCASLLVGAAFAQDHEDFKAAMKTAGASFGSLRKTVEAKQGPESVEAADKLAGVFEHAQMHFSEHHMEDGVTFAKTGHQAAQNLAAAAKAGEWEKASAELKTIGAQCQGCHAAHREKLPDGSFKMK